MASGNPGMRPRANTLSHVDAATIGMLANAGPAMNRHLVGSHNHHHSISGMPSAANYSYRGMSTHHAPGLPKLETAGLPMDLSGGLRTAPPYSGFGNDFPLGFPHNSGSTINPHALHMSDMDMDQSITFQQMFYANGMTNGMNAEDHTFDWIARGFENQMTFNNQGNENAIDDSSPSAMSTNSPSNLQDMVGDMHPASTQHPGMTNPHAWAQVMPNHIHNMSSPVSMDFTNNLNDMMMTGPNGMLSPKSMLAQNHGVFDMNLPTPPDMANIDMSNLPPGMVYNNSFQLPVGRQGGTSSASTASMDSSLRQSSVTTTSGELVTDSVRNTLVAGLSQSNPFNQRKYSQPLISSPLSPESPSKVKGFSASTFPTTHDLQRYVAAYVKFFHPHLPFLHIPSLNFESSEYGLPNRFNISQPNFGPGNMTGGGSCLVLSIAAIGAVYEREMDASRELFQCAHRFIFSYLEMRRKADMHRTQFAPRHASESEETPLWLVQAMLLHVIYGHNCGDKTAAEVASNHCSSLVSLARDAHLARPSSEMHGMRKGSSGPGGHHPDMNSWTSMLNESEEMDWIEWKATEERKRTLYAVFILSSMLVMAYNHAPALTNSEIRLELPCDEELWSAESSQAWQALGGANHPSSRSITFAAALSHLLMSSQRHRRKSMSGPQGPSAPEQDLRPSTFGCLILINALHNYIWETRQRHLGRQWTERDTEQMHAHIEPALRAWEAAWASNPTHSLERPNPFGAGPLSADSVPLLDLAYVRLYINLGRSKEAFWQRDYNSMAEEVARSPEVAGFDAAPVKARRKSTTIQEHNSPDTKISPTTEGEVDMHQSTRRERQLRRAAFYASDSLLMSDKLGLIFEESKSEELTAQSALCAFDCAQVLSEWLTTVQERVGKYVGVLGQDDVDLGQVPAVLLLEDEDRQLLGKIDDFVRRTEQKVHAENTTVREGGYSPRILTLTAQLLDRAAVWPGKSTYPAPSSDS
jgi:hypothetical protein